MKEKTIKMFKRTFKFSLCMLLAIAIGTAFGATNSVMQQSEMSLTMFKAGLITEPTVFRVNIRIASSRHAYNDLLQNYSGATLNIIDNFWAVEVSPIDRQSNQQQSDANLFCFVTKKSEAGKTVAEALKDGNWHMALVSLRYSKNPKFRMCCTMDQVTLADVSKFRGQETKRDIVHMKPKQYSLTTKKTFVLSGIQKEGVLMLDETYEQFIVVGDYIVPKGCELKITEGVTIVAKKKASITIQGKLNIQGTKEKPVIIKGSITGYGTWDGIRVIRSESCAITFAHVSNAKIAIEGDASQIYIRNSTFCKNDEVASVKERSGKLKLEQCYATQNKRGVSYHHTTVEMDFCTFTQTRESAISGSYYGDVVLNKCAIFKNGAGIKDGGYEGRIEGHGCAIFMNNKFDVQNDSTVPGDFTGNFWGKQSIGILTRNGGTKLPKVTGRVVNLAGWLAEEPVNCGAKDYPAVNLK